MTMDGTDTDQLKEASTSDASGIRNGVASQESLSKKKPPGEIDESEYEQGFEGGEEDEEEEELNFGNASTYSVKERNALFGKGLNFEKKQKPDQALKCYLESMKGIQSKSHYALLPECLKNIADIYHAQGNYEKAIQFAQAEKLFYETALIETKEIQMKLEGEEDETQSETPKDLNELNFEVLKAEEYEHLARLCLDNGQPQLALEYVGKCAQIRQDVLGNNHIKTRETLDLFASVYAEVGKEEYSDSINEMRSLLDRDAGLDDADFVPEVVIGDSPALEPVSILRQRNVSTHISGGDSPTEKKQVRFHESVDDSIRRKRHEEMVSLTMTLVLLGICFLILGALGVWLYCSMDRVQTCPALAHRLKAWALALRYRLHQITSYISSSSSSGSPNKMEYAR